MPELWQPAPRGGRGLRVGGERVAEGATQRVQRLGAQPAHLGLVELEVVGQLRQRALLEEVALDHGPPVARQHRDGLPHLGETGRRAGRAHSAGAGGPVDPPEGLDQGGAHPGRGVRRELAVGGRVVVAVRLRHRDQRGRRQLLPRDRRRHSSHRLGDELLHPVLISDHSVCGVRIRGSPHGPHHANQLRSGRAGCPGLWRNSTETGGTSRPGCGVAPPSARRTGDFAGPHATGEAARVTAARWLRPPASVQRSTTRSPGS